MLKQYLDNAHKDIYEVKQLRLCICSKDHALLGLIDLFDFDPKNRRAGVGIVVAESSDRERGFGSEALALMSEYAFHTLALRQLFAYVGEQNKPSIHLFAKLGFKKAGLLEDWTRYGTEFRNVLLFQKISS